MFVDREQAGKLLGEKLKDYKRSKNTIVFGIARGGVVVADQIAKRLEVPLQVLVIKKIGAPLSPELAIGAVGPENTVYWDEKLLGQIRPNKDYKKDLSSRKNRQRKDLEKYLLEGKRQRQIKGTIAIVADDGVATGATIFCALEYLKKRKAAKILLATPVIAEDTYLRAEKEFDSIMAVEIATNMNSVGQFYENFYQVENEEVKAIIDKQEI